MRVHPRFFVFLCLAVVLATARQTISGGDSAATQTAEKVSFCQLLAHPETYSGRVVVTTVHLYMFKEGVSLRSPDCNKKAVWLLIESTSGPGVPELSRRISPRPFYARHPLVATLTGILDPNHYDEALRRKRAVFKVIAARDISQSRKSREDDTVAPSTDLRGVLKDPSKYAGKTITVVARISFTKEGGFLWSPGCSKRRVRLIIDLKDESGTAGGFLAALRRHGLSDHPVIATLTGIYVPDYYDNIRNRHYPVFRVTAAAHVTRSRNVERP